MTARVLVLSPGPPADLVAALEGALRGAGRLVLPQSGAGRAELHALLQTADVVVGDWSGRFVLGPDEARVAERARLVQQPGAGVEHIDLGAWAARGIPVGNARGANAASVAEWSLAAVLALVRRLGPFDTMVRAGEWPAAETAVAQSRELRDLRVGIVGFGPIGVECARLLAPFGCSVGYWSRRRRDPAEEVGAVYRELDDLLATSDVLVVAVALTAATRGLLDARHLALLPEGAVLVNVARGAVVDERALVDALAAGRLGGAALDVFAVEPLPPASPLLSAPNTLLSPHLAGGTAAARARTFAAAAENVARALRGEPLHGVLNGVGA